MTSETKADKQMQQDLAQVAADMRAYLKQQSKKELIRLVMEQVNLVIKHQQLNRLLHEENSALKSLTGNTAADANASTESK